MTLREFLQIINRRKWIVLQTILIIVAVAVSVSATQPKRYESTARVLLSWQNLANQLTNTGGSSVVQQPDRLAQTQAAIARTTSLATQVLKHVHAPGLTAGGLLAESSVSPNPSTDVLVFTVDDGNPVRARQLVNRYAVEYTVARLRLDNAAILRARAGVEDSLHRLDIHGSRRSALYADLINRDQTLATMQALQTSNASVLQQAQGAAQVQPRVKRTAMLALVLGVILALAFAFLWETLDTKVRDAEEIGRHLGGIPLLGRLPPPSKRLDAESKLLMAEKPNSADAEPFKMLRTNVEFVLLGIDTPTLMVTSAVEQEGKSTTAANLAIALARMGRRVVLVDLDLHAPRIGDFFRHESPGVIQVVLGHADLDSALRRIPLQGSESGFPRLRSGGGNLLSLSGGSLHILPAGGSPPDRSAFFGSNALASIFDALRQRGDLVIVDAPPALQAGDAMALSRQVDGIIVVARVNRVRRPMLAELHRLLEISPARALGFVALGQTGELSYDYGYGSRGYPSASADVVSASAGEVAR
jgi:polysaccharide biosynthesis transport protein